MSIPKLTIRLSDSCLVCLKNILIFASMVNSNVKKKVNFRSNRCLLRILNLSTEVLKKFSWEIVDRTWKVFLSACYAN